MENLDENNKNVSLSLIAGYGDSDSDSDDAETPSIENAGADESEDGTDGAELSEMVLKNNIINACAHGPLSGSRAAGDETTRHMIIDSSESGVVEYEVTEYRDVDTSDSDSDSSSDSSDSDVESVKDIEELSSSDEAEGGKANKQEPVKVHGEQGLDDLPQIEDLAISLPAHECTKIGTIASIVDRLVIVRALPETPAVDLDSVLFLDNGAKALGKVFDVFGPVTEPHYCVRFNSTEHVKERGIQPGMDVFIAPKNQEHTSYVFLSELMKVKGSDASWLNDIEPPPNQVDYSDDEEERRAKKERQQNKQQTNEQESETDDTERVQGRRILEGRRNQRPSESSSRFGSGPSRGRNPFSGGGRRNQNPFPRYGRPWPVNMDMRTPPQHGDPNGPPPFTAPPFPPMPMFPPPFNPNTPPPFMGNGFQFGANPRMQGPPIPMPNMPPPFHNGPIFGSTYCNVAGPQWVNNGHPPPPGT